MNQNNSSEQEIDLSQLANKIKEAINHFFDKVFDVIFFIKSNIKILISLMVLGVAIGVLISRVNKKYEQKIIVNPNFHSIDYLYNKIELINAKLAERDSVFFKSIGITNYKNLGKINIEPIIDIYEFVENDNQASNFELIRLFVQEDKVKNIIEDKITSKNFKTHLIQFETKKPISREQVIDPLMNYFNTSDYYTEIKNLTLEGAKSKIKANDSIVVQIDKIIDNYIKSNNQTPKNQLLYINENNQLNELIHQKSKLLEENTHLNISLIKEDQIIKQVSIDINALDIQQKNKNLKYILPIFFVAVFILIKLFIAFYKSQIKKRNL